MTNLLRLLKEAEDNLIELTGRFIYRINGFDKQLEYETIYNNKIYKSCKRFSKLEVNSSTVDIMLKLRLTACLALLKKIKETK